MGWNPPKKSFVLAKFPRLNVSRFSGRETELRHVHVPNAYFVPGWAPGVARFTVYLNLEEDAEGIPGARGLCRDWFHTTFSHICWN